MLNNKSRTPVKVILLIFLAFAMGCIIPVTYRGRSRASRSSPRVIVKTSPTKVKSVKSRKGSVKVKKSVKVQPIPKGYVLVGAKPRPNRSCLKSGGNWYCR